MMILQRWSRRDEPWKKQVHVPWKPCNDTYRHVGKYLNTKKIHLQRSSLTVVLFSRFPIRILNTIVLVTLVTLIFTWIHVISLTECMDEHLQHESVKNKGRGVIAIMLFSVSNYPLTSWLLRTICRSIQQTSQVDLGVTSGFRKSQGSKFRVLHLD
jgi:uncharacterized protein with PQ loop repeat